MKKLLSLLLIIFFLAPQVCFAAETVPQKIQADGSSVFQGYAEITDKKNDKSDLFTGEIDKIETKEAINLTVSQVLSEGYTESGDEFFAEVTSEVEGSKGTILQRGTIAHGRVLDMSEAKRLGRDGYIVLEFDYLITPDGREIPINGHVSTKSNLAVGVAKNVAIDTGYTLAGGAVGGLVALNMFGIEAAVASQGYTVAGGAAIGAAVGLGMGLYRKGKSTLIQPGNIIKMHLKEGVTLPVLSEKALKQDELQYKGLTVRINNIKYEKDPFGEPNTITLMLSINNFSNKTFSSFSIALMNDKNKYFYPSMFNDSDLMFKKIKIGDRVIGKLSFNVDNTRDAHWLVFMDSANGKPLAKISIDAALKEIQKNKKNKKKNKKVTTVNQEKKQNVKSSKKVEKSK